MNKNIKRILVATLILSTVMSSTALAAVPNGSVVIGESAYNLAYANNPTNPTNTVEITDAVVNSGGKIYIKDFSGNWIDNTTGNIVNKELIPEVIYRDENGQTKYAANDGDEIKNSTDKEEKENKTSSAFDNPDLDEYLSTQFVDIDTDKELIYFNEEGFFGYDLKHYLPESDYNPKMNKQIYNLLKSRIENNERGNYTDAKYIRSSNKEHTLIAISIAESKQYFAQLYSFIFEEKGIVENSNPYYAPIRLNVDFLSDYHNSENWLYDEYYVERLREDLKVLFGDSGSNICDYVFDEYMSEHDNYNEYLDGKRTEDSLPFVHNKVIGNIKVYSVLNSNLDHNFYFVENN